MRRGPKKPMALGMKIEVAFVGVLVVAGAVSMMTTIMGLL